MRCAYLGLAVALLGIGAGAQMTAQQVVAKSLAARGGAARFAAVRSLSFVGTLDVGTGKPARIAVWTAPNPSRIRIEVELPEGKLVQGYDGTAAWQINPGETKPIALDAGRARQIADQAINFVDLMADTDKVAKLELLGQGSLDGHDYYQLRFTLSTGDSFTQYVDAHTWLAFHEEYPGGVEEISDYREVEGILLPFHFASGPAGQPGTPLVREQITLNAPVSADLFRMP